MKINRPCGSNLSFSRMQRFALVALLMLLAPVLVVAASALVYEQKVTCHKDNAFAAGAGSPDVVVYTNRTRGNVSLTGDLIVKKNTCPVRVTFGPAAADSYEIPNSNNDVQDSSTVTVPAGFAVFIHCRLRENTGSCDWKYQRSSP